MIKIASGQLRPDRRDVLKDRRRALHAGDVGSAHRLGLAIVPQEPAIEDLAVQGNLFTDQRPLATLIDDVVEPRRSWLRSGAAAEAPPGGAAIPQ